MIAALAAAGATAALAGALHRRSTCRPLHPAPPASHTATDWPSLLDHIGRLVRAGDSLTVAVHEAIRHTGASGAAVGPGLTPAHAAYAHTDDPDERYVLHALATAVAIGGAPASVLHAAADVLRERAAVRADARSHAAAARLSGRVLTGVPLAFACMGAATSQAVRDAILSPRGLIVTVAGLLLNEGGRRWMRHIIRAACP